MVAVLLGFCKAHRNDEIFLTAVQEFCAACNFFLPTRACRKFCFFKITHPLPQELNGRPLTSLVMILFFTKHYQEKHTKTKLTLVKFPMKHREKKFLQSRSLNKAKLLCCFREAKRLRYFCSPRNNRRNTFSQSRSLKKPSFSVVSGMPNDCGTFVPYETPGEINSHIVAT